MHKQRLRKTPLAAAIATFVCLVVPAVAEAHHVNSAAACVLVGDQPTLRLTADFVDFSSTHTVSGTVWVDGTQTFSGTVPVTWTGNNGKWTYTRPATAGRSYTVTTQWTWSGGSDGETHTTGKCPTPPNRASRSSRTAPARVTSATRRRSPTG